MKKQKRLARVEIGMAIDKGWANLYWWKLVGANGQIICNSEMFKRRADAKRAMRRAIQIIQGGQYRVEE